MMIDEIREQIQKLLDERDAKYAESRKLLATAVSEARSMNDEETEQYKTVRAEADKLDARVQSELKPALADLEADEARDEERKQFAATVTPAAKTGAAAQVHVTSEPSPYDERSSHSFFMDAAMVSRGKASRDQRERYERHENEVRADNVTGDFSSLVVPQYLPEKFAPNLSAGRVTADIIANEPLSDEGMVFTLPRATQSTVVAAQSGENTQVASQSYDTEDLVFHLETYAGQVDLSLQSRERGRNIDSILYKDLASQYVVKVNADVINGPGHNVGKRHLGILQTSGRATVTCSVSTGVGIVRKVHEALSVVNTRRLEGADAVVMHPARWNYLLSSVDGSNRPLMGLSDSVPQNVWGQGDANKVNVVSPVGSIGGVPVYTDALVPNTLSLGTTGADEDVIMVLKRDDIILFEENRLPRRWEFEQTLGGTLAIKLVIAGFSSFTAGRYPQSIAVVQGIGLRTPVFG